ncbi:MAG: UDP-N-acetylmuramoyl-L-alanine--D-glutamate ligase, partial [Phycisphaerae bacterium]|nr:UDP-N-acetylmuramoyl-L-alanine--D-glutamate ligase [Phycisphaerae bacterium]
VTVSDMKGAGDLAESLKQLDGLDLTLHLGGHDERDFSDAELVVANPAVKPGAPPLQIARAAGVAITTEMNLFVERCPATCVGVTGSVGKSTITAMIGHILEHAQDKHRVLVGGNIGRSLLDSLAEITRDDIVVLELSSFQLHYTPLVRWSPHVAVITNITPNHIDWHGDFAAYVADKLNIGRFQDRSRDALIIGDEPELRKAVTRELGEAGVWCYGLDGDTPTAVGLAGGSERRLAWADARLAIPGRHNRLNAAAALTVARILEIEPAETVKALAGFAGLPHRLCRVATVNGVSYYDDSKCTTPEAVITALNAIDGPTLIILGGYDKKSDLTPAVEAVAKKARFAACLGQTGPGLHASLRERGAAAELCGSLEEAVAACHRHADAGDSVLLSPGCASWDMFRDYRVRGAQFADCVKRVAGA